MLSLYICLEKKIKAKIFNEVSISGLNIAALNIREFEAKIFILCGIRNCVYHNNSLEILKNYFDISKNIFRNKNNREDYVKVINYLINYK